MASCDKTSVKKTLEELVQSYQEVTSEVNSISQHLKSTTDTIENLQDFLNTIKTIPEVVKLKQTSEIVKAVQKIFGFIVPLAKRSVQ